MYGALNRLANHWGTNWDSDLGAALVSATETLRNNARDRLPFLPQRSGLRQNGGNGHSSFNGALAARARPAATSDGPQGPFTAGIQAVDPSSEDAAAVSVGAVAVGPSHGEPVPTDRTVGRIGDPQMGTHGDAVGDLAYTLQGDLALDRSSQNAATGQNVLTGPDGEGSSAMLEDNQVVIQRILTILEDPKNSEPAPEIFMSAGEGSPASAPLPQGSISGDRRDDADWDTQAAIQRILAILEDPKNSEPVPETFTPAGEGPPASAPLPQGPISGGPSRKAQWDTQAVIQELLGMLENDTQTDADLGSQALAGAGSPAGPAGDETDWDTDGTDADDEDETTEDPSDATDVQEATKEPSKIVLASGERQAAGLAAIRIAPPSPSESPDLAANSFGSGTRATAEGERDEVDSSGGTDGPTIRDAQQDPAGAPREDSGAGSPTQSDGGARLMEPSHFAGLAGSPANSGTGDSGEKGPQLSADDGSTWDLRVPAPAPSRGKSRRLRHKHRHHKGAPSSSHSWAASPGVQEVGSERAGSPEGPSRGATLGSLWGPAASPPSSVRDLPRQAYNLLCPMTVPLPLGRPHLGRSSRHPPAGEVGSEPRVVEEELLAQEIEDALMRILRRRGLQTHVPSPSPAQLNATYVSQHDERSHVSTPPAEAATSGLSHLRHHAAADGPPASSTEYPGYRTVSQGTGAMSPGVPEEREATAQWSGKSVDVACLGGALAIAIAVSAFGSSSALAEIGCGHGQCALAPGVQNLNATAPKVH